MKTLAILKPFTFEGIIIDAGWRAEIPTASFSADDGVILRYAREFQRVGAPHAKSFQIAESACQRLWEVKILTSVKNSVGWHAKAYRESFGDLEGFDATRVAKKFVPYVPKFYGRNGIPTMRALMAAMREER